MDRNLALESLRVTEVAALAAARFIGRGDRTAADMAAVEAMRRAFDGAAIDGEVVIGQGERDEVPSLWVGERVGRGTPDLPKVDVVVDPLQGTKLCATGAGNAISIAAMATRGSILRTPDAYMEKVAAGAGARGAIDIRLSATENVRRVADALGKSVDEVTVVILDRPRHERLVKEVRETGARIKLIRDGDIAGALETCFPSAGVDMLMGIGGAPEGVVAAAALRCVGGDLQGRLVWRDERDRQRAREMGLDLDRVYSAEELAAGDVVFALTGVTSGDLLGGVTFTSDGAVTHSVVMRSRTGTLRRIETVHHFERKASFGR